MTTDEIDRAFIARWRSGRSARRLHDGQAAPEPVRKSAGRAAAEILSPAADLVMRLLHASRDQWVVLADEVESARLAGRRVIGVAGCERGEGRTTLVACLAHTLRERGRDVMVRGGREPVLVSAGDAASDGAMHDRRIILVDAGVWFPPGPIHRPRLLLASLGCDAVILVRRADREPSAARAAALTAIGIDVLGEVLTLGSPVPPAVLSGDA